MPTVAVIDIGTNSVRLDVRKLHDGKTWELLTRQKEVIRLGRSVFTEGIIDEESERALVENLTKFQKKIRHFNADETLCVGTSALREARNSDAILERLRAELGIVVEIIPGEREAELIARGVVENEGGLENPFLLIDIGGGSTELTEVNCGQVVRSHSLPLGALRLQEVFLKSIPPLPRAEDADPIASCCRHASETLQSLFPRRDPSIQLVGSSGTVKALGRIFQVIPGDDMTDAPIDSAERPTYTLLDLRDFIGRASSMSRDELAALPRVDKKRAEVLLAGALLLERIMSHFGADDIRVTDYSLRDGLYQEWLRNRFPRALDSH
ncbi:MAG: hypothetical protein IT290_13325 [Deltaproteobacteria bacterium]|nr:hypothetical protein [Deltaproteobacteria bacterium]